MEAKSYRNFADLERHCKRGRDFEILISRRPSSRVAIVAPHAGRIEQGTSGIARAIAGDDLNLYLLEGTMRFHNYEALHLTSHRFDEPECLALVATCSVVVTVHGCKGEQDKVLIGGLDQDLKELLSASFAGAGIAQQLEHHGFPATDPNNICNRGSSRKGAQLEISGSLRRSQFRQALTASVRAAIRAHESAIDR